MMYLSTLFKVTWSHPGYCTNDSVICHYNHSTNIFCSPFALLQNQALIKSHTSFTPCAAIQLKAMEKTHDHSDWSYLNLTVTVICHQGAFNATQTSHHTSLTHSFPLPMTIPYLLPSPKTSKTISPFLLSADDFASYCTKKVETIKRELLEDSSSTVFHFPASMPLNSSFPLYYG